MDRRQRNDVAIDVDNRRRKSASQTEIDRRKSLGFVTR